MPNGLLFLLRNQSSVAAPAFEHGERPPGGRVQDACSELGLLTAARAAWGNRFRPVLGHRLTAK